MNGAERTAPLARPLPHPAVGAGPDPRELRRCFGGFATGVTVVTAGRTIPHGMTANAFTSVSLDPPLILVCVLREAAMHAAILAEEAFAVSVLAAHQETVARYFADKSRPRGEHEFDVVDQTAGRFTGAPILTGAVSWLECKLAAVHDGGDHSVFVGEVLDFGRGAVRDALVFYGGAFRRLEPGGR